jgi:hypothetical protein
MQVLLRNSENPAGKKSTNLTHNNGNIIALPPCNIRIRHHTRLGQLLSYTQIPKISYPKSALENLLWRANDAPIHSFSKQLYEAVKKKKQLHQNILENHHS